MAWPPVVASWNVLKSNSVSNIKTGLSGLMSRGADIICLQEMSDDGTHSSIRSYMQSKGFYCISNNNNVPIYIRSKTYAVQEEHDVLVVNGPHTVENGTAGTSFGDKHMNWMRLRCTANNKMCYIINVHLYPGIDGGGGIFKASAPLRVYWANVQINAMVALANSQRATKAPVFVTGDHNLNYYSTGSLTKRMTAIGFTANWQTLGKKATHTVRTIDYVWSSNTKATYQTVPGKYGSDHSAVLVKHGVTAATPIKAPNPADPSVSYGAVSGSSSLALVTNRVTRRTNIYDLYVMGIKLKANIAEAVTEANITGGFGQVTQLTMTVLDPTWQILNTGLFNIGTSVRYQSIYLLVSSIATKMVAGQRALEIVARPASVAALKKRTGSKVMTNASPSDFIAAECKAIGAKYNIQSSAKRAQVARDLPAAGEVYDVTNRPSSWTTFQRLADELGYICFEVSGMIHFGKPSYFLAAGRSKPMDINWNKSVTGSATTLAEAMPEVTKSEDSTEGVTMSAILPPERIPQAPLGRVVRLTGMSSFNGYYLINSVSFDIAGVSNRLQINAATAIDAIPAGTTSTTTSTSTVIKQPPAGKYAGRSISSSQMANAVIIYKEAIKAGVGTRGATAGIMTAIVEANLLNPNYGDRDSLGSFQQRATWASAASRMKVNESAARFFAAMKRVSNYKTMALGTLCQKIQVSAFGSRYAVQQATATAIVAAIVKNSTTTSSTTTTTRSTTGVKYPVGPSNSKRASDMVTWALSRVGISKYVFGATRVTSNTDLRVFDCSSLVRWACARVGVYMPYNTRDQEPYLKGSGGHSVTLSKAKTVRGALLYYPGAHVAISLGNGKTVEAANPKTGVKVGSASWSKYRTAYTIDALIY